MKFEYLQPKNKKIDTEELIKDLVDVAKLLGKTPTRAEYDSNGKYSSSTFGYRFGNWNSALQQANLPIIHKTWTELELFSNIEKVWVYLGKQPTKRDMDKEYSDIPSETYRSRFQTWSNALQAFVNYINAYESDDIYENNDSENKVVDCSRIPKRRRDFNLRERFIIFKRDNFRCCICGRSPATTIGLELQADHIKPWSKGGETTIDNGQTLCRDCNEGKSDLE